MALHKYTYDYDDYDMDSVSTIKPHCRQILHDNGEHFYLHTTNCR